MSVEGDSLESCPLVGPISAEQFVLLEAIARTVIAPHLHGGVSEWPAWAYVEEQVEGTNPEIDLLQVFESLPEVRGLPGANAYRWVWRADNQTTTPTPEERVGLSIAGLYQLHRAGRATGLADALVRLLAALADLEKVAARSDVAGPTTMDVPLARHATWFTEPTPEKPYAVPVDVIGQLLRREYFPVLLLESQKRWDVRLGNRWLRKYLSLESAAGYLQRVATQSRGTGPAAYMSQRYRPSSVDKKVILVTTPSISLEPGWNQPESDTRHLIQLDWIYDARSSGPRVNVGELFADPSLDEEAIRVDLRGFEASGWIELSETYDVESIDCALTSAGSRFVEKVRQQRADLSGRRKAARDAFLAWLYNETLAGRSVPNIDAFSSSSYGIYLAQPFTPEEVGAASRWLKDMGLLTGTAVQGGAIPRPHITAEGEAIVESGRSVNELLTAGEPTVPISYVTVSGNNNIVQSASPRSIANVSVAITEDHRRQTLELADTIEQALPVLSSDASNLPPALRAAVSAEQHEPGVLKLALEGVKAKLATGAGERIGAAILLASSGLFQHYGIPL